MSISESVKEMPIIKKFSYKYQLKTDVLIVTVRRETPVICKTVKNGMAVKWPTFTCIGDETKCSTKLLKGANTKILFRTYDTIGRSQKLKVDIGDCGSTVVKVLCYKSEGRWFDPRWCQWNFSLT